MTYHCLELQFQEIQLFLPPGSQYSYTHHPYPHRYIHIHKIKVMKTRGEISHYFEICWLLPCAALQYLIWGHISTLMLSYTCVNVVEVTKAIWVIECTFLSYFVLSFQTLIDFFIIYLVDIRMKHLHQPFIFNLCYWYIIVGKGKKLNQMYKKTTISKQFSLISTELNGNFKMKLLF